MTKPKVAFYWCASCGGCEEAVVDLAENILPVIAAVEIVLWPVALDFKRQDIEDLPDGAILASFINGAIRTTEQEEMVQLLRCKSQIVIAFGSCAQLGGIPGLANLSTRETLLKTAYLTAPSVVNPEQVLPAQRTIVDGKELELPELQSEVRALDQVIAVDYYVPGCAPPPDLVQQALTALLENKLPPKGTVLAPQKALCETCPRKDTKPDILKIGAIKRVAEAPIPTDKCFLAEGFICLGPATRGGCGERCIRANMPCEGCFGPIEGVTDQGAKFLGALSSLIDSTDEQEIETILKTVLDPAGKFYMFSLPRSLGVRFLDKSE